MTKSIKKLYRTGFTAKEISNILNKSEYSVNKVIHSKNYNVQYAKEHKAFNMYKNGHRVNNVVKELGKSKSAFYRELKKSGSKSKLQELHNNDFVKQVQKFLRNAENKNYKNYIIAKGEYEDDLIESWKKSGKKVPKFMFTGINSKSDLRDFDLPIKKFNKIAYLDNSGDRVSKKEFISLYDYDISNYKYGDAE